MTVIEAMLQYHRLRAPTNDGGVLVEPPVEHVASLLAANRNLRSIATSDRLPGRIADYDFQGRRFGELAAQSSRDLLLAATSYTRSYRDVDPGDNDTSAMVPMILAGHQPELFHVGVWAKNFAIDRIAKAHGGIGINLLIDSDVPKSAALRVPSGTVQRPAVKNVMIAEISSPMPYEEWSVTDAATFESFGRRAADTIEPLVADPLVASYWPLVVERSRAESRVGYCIAQARHQLEGKWGTNTLEVPQSHICSSESFYWFAAHLLAHLPRLHEIYNNSVAEYRQVHRLRSKAHPVTDLGTDDDWLEAPFWIWSSQDAQRRRLYCRYRGSELLLSDGRDLELPLALSPDSDADTAVNQLADLAERGIKIRTRALITTMYARLMAGDLFVHGIGGAKYDQLTDQLIRRFFEIEPPGYLAFSGTLKLPIPRPQVSAESLRSINCQLRDLEFNPDRYLSQQIGDANGLAWRELVENKRRWVNTPQNVENARTRFNEIRGTNKALQPFVTDKSRQLRSERERILQQLRAEGILSSRDYAFCLFPGSLLFDYLLDILPESL